jgi:hypothetical protein
MSFCPCGEIATQGHHKFHNTGWARALYGALIDHPINKQPACSKCNPGHAGTKLTHWTEQQFCKAMGIAVRSKTELGKKLRSIV